MLAARRSLKPRVSAGPRKASKVMTGMGGVALMSTSPHSLDCTCPGAVVNAGTLGLQHKRSWAQFYKAALFELDANKVSDRIAEAETALVTRARELFQSAKDNIDEEHAVDDAMCALHAFRSTLKCRPKAEGASQELAA